MLRFAFVLPRSTIRRVDPGRLCIFTSTCLADQTPPDWLKPKYVNSFTISPSFRRLFHMDGVADGVVEPRLDLGIV